MTEKIKEINSQKPAHEFHPPVKQEPTNQEDTRIFHTLSDEDWLDYKVLATKAVIKGPENLDEATLAKVRFIKTLGNLAGRKTALTDDERFQEVKGEEVEKLEKLVLTLKEGSLLMFQYYMWLGNDSLVDGLRIKRGDEVK